MSWGLTRGSWPAGTDNRSRQARASPIFTVNISNWLTPCEKGFKKASLGIRILSPESRGLAGPEPTGREMRRARRPGRKWLIWE